MSFQINKIVLYSHTGEKREIKLEIGKLNIITGHSKTGKTALIGIVDYCFGRRSCPIPIGHIRNKSKWVAVQIKVPSGFIFIARKLPAPGKDYCSDIYYEIQKEQYIPDFSKLMKNANIVAIRQLLSKHININENINKNELKANIRHSLYFTFQKQNELMQSGLFHRQNDQVHIFNHIKDTIPYFIGAVDQNDIDKKEKLRYLRRKMRKIDLNLAEAESIKGEGIEKALSLILESKDMGLFSDDTVPQNLEDSIILLKEIRKSPLNIGEIAENEDSSFEELQLKRKEILSKIQEIKEQLAVFRRFDLECQEYSKESNMRLDRLRSIGLFDKKEKTDLCPVCSSKISNQKLPQFEDFEKSMKKLEKQIRGVDERSPNLQKAIRLLNGELQDLKEELRTNNQNLEDIHNTNQKLKEFRDYLEKKAYFMGKIDFYLESLIPLNDEKLHEKRKEIKNEIEIIESEISNKRIEERLRLIIKKIGKDMTNWAQELNLEHSENQVCLDLNQLTVKFLTEDGIQKLSNIGSGENWVGYHVVTILALHKWFVTNKRPVPRFLFVDQPSQIAFPPDVEIEEDYDNESEDHKIVKRIFKLFYDVVEDLKPEFQVIITDHANFKKEKWFQESLVAEWRNGEKLVPKNWPSIKDIQKK